MQTLPPPVDQLVGKMLGHYDVEQLLGYGKINAVYAAQQQPQKRSVMLTAFTLPETLALQARERFMTRFTQNASILVRLNHPHILPTYDSGEQFGYPYLVTPFVTGGSLAKVIRQEKRCTPEYVLQIVKQVAEGLDYAHQNGVVHGMLKPANILLDNEHGVQIAGFNLINILRMQGIEAMNHPYPHLISIAGTFLGSPEYIAPEVVQGAVPDQRADIYALGIMIFELLTGRVPFTGSDPFETAMQHVQQTIPPLQSLYAEVPAGLDLVVQRALERNPSQRIQSAGKLASAFERVLSLIQRAPLQTRTMQETISSEPEMTLPPTVNWFDDEKASSTSGRIPVMLNTPAESGNWQLRPPIVTNQMAAVRANTGKNIAMRQYVNMPDAVEERSGQNAVDPFVLWTGGMPAAPHMDAKAAVPESPPFDLQEIDNKAEVKASKLVKRAEAKANKLAKQEAARANKLTKKADTQANKADKVARKANGTGSDKVEQWISSSKSSRSEQPIRKSRRRAIAKIATGSVIAAGMLGAGGIALTHFLNTGNATTTVPVANNAAATVPTQATKQQQQQPPAQQPKQQQPAANTQPAQPTHTGTVVGKKTQGVNSAQAFKNPIDAQDSLLVRLPNGNFAAYERACTHQQVPVDYDPVTHTFICPLHHSVFDPAQNGKVLQGPANQPLPAVTIHVNGDGTITV